MRALIESVQDYMHKQAKVRMLLHTADNPVHWTSAKEKSWLRLPVFQLKTWHEPTSA